MMRTVVDIENRLLKKAGIDFFQTGGDFK